mgnify:CR=1 FL=1
MSLENVKVGDKLRYLGGDPANTGELLRGRVYEVVDVDYDDIVIDTIDNGSWGIGDAYKNTDCFELVEEVKEGDLIEVTKTDNDTYFDVGHIGKVIRIVDDNDGDYLPDIYVDFNGYDNPFVFGDGMWFVGGGGADSAYRVVDGSPAYFTNLSQEVAELKRELSDLRDAAQAQAYEVDERIKSVEKRIDSRQEAELCRSCGKPMELEKAGKRYEFVCYDCEPNRKDDYLSSKTLDLLAELAGRVAHIERLIRDIKNQVDMNAEDIETWAQDIAELQARRELK